MTIPSFCRRFFVGFILGAGVVLALGSPRLHAHPTYQQLAAFSHPPHYVLGSLTDDETGFLWGTSSIGGTYGFGTVFKINKNTGEMSTVIDFTDAGEVNKGSGPTTSLINDGAGFMWGVTDSGGTVPGGAGNGTVFKVNIATGVLTTVVIFTGEKGRAQGQAPEGALVRDGGGFLWGTTAAGGAHSDGTIFKIKIATGAFQTIAAFSINDSKNPNSFPTGALCDDGHGFFWGTTGSGGADFNGSVFKVNQHTGKLTTVIQFEDGADPEGVSPGALASDGAGFLWGTTLFGSTGGRGTVFKIDTATGELTTVVRFGSLAGHGDSPIGGMVSDGAGNMWGTTTDSADNVNGNGTIFKINTTSGALTTVASFTGTGGAIPGRQPVAELVNDGAGHFLATTSGGTENMIYSTAFSVEIATGNVTTLAVFDDHNALFKGREPHAAIIDDGAGHFWGTTYFGGAHDLGTVFKIDQSTGTFTAVVEFDDSTITGAHPDAPLVSDGAGFLWGTTFSGGSSNDGTVFKIDSASGTLTTEVQFDNTSVKGIGPSSALVPDGMGYLWGGTSGGDDNTTGDEDENGTIFKIQVGTGTFATVAQFGASGLRGGSITAPLVNDGAGNFLGVVNSTFGSAVFSIGIATGVFTQLGSLGDLGESDGSVVDDGLGYLWGTLNGEDTGGGIFKLKKDTGAVTQVIALDDTPPTAGLIKDSAGQLWGTTKAVQLESEGTVFKIDPATGIFTKVIDFTGAGGAFAGSDPRAELLFAGAGVFYGTTAAGGSSPAGIPLGGGNVFRLDTASGGQDDFFAFFAKPAIPQTLDVLTNDTSSNHYPLTITSVSAASGGTVDIINGGTALTYTAGKKFTGTDTFTYTISDGHGGVSFGTVRLGNPFQFYAGTFQNVLVSNGAEGDVFVNVVLSKKGAFSVAVKDRAGAYSAKGVFDMAGQATVTLKRKPPLSNLQATLALSDATGVLNVSVDDGTGPVAGDLLANQIFPKTAPAPVQAATMIIEPPAPFTPGLPGGTGWATIAQSKTGALKIVGKTGDGVAFSAASARTTIGANSGFVLYSTINKQPAWRLYGQLAYEARDLLFDGMLTWEKPMQAKTQLFDGGFTLAPTAHGSTYRPPPSFDLIIGSDAHGGDLLATLSDGGLSAPFTKTFTLSAAPMNKLTVDSPAADKFKIGLSARTGRFTGSVILPGSHKASVFSGVAVFVPSLNPDDHIGLGVFQTETGTGTIRLDAQ